MIKEALLRDVETAAMEKGAIPYANPTEKVAVTVDAAYRALRNAVEDLTDPRQNIAGKFRRIISRMHAANPRNVVRSNEITDGIIDGALKRGYRFKDQLNGVDAFLRTGNNAILNKNNPGSSYAMKQVGRVMHPHEDMLFPGVQRNPSFFGRTLGHKPITEYPLAAEQTQDVTNILKPNVLKDNWLEGLSPDVGHAVRKTKAFRDGLVKLNLNGAQAMKKFNEGTKGITTRLNRGLTNWAGSANGPRLLQGS